MPHVQPTGNWYDGPVDFDSQPLNWIRKHQSFASREWVESQVRYGEWAPDKNKKQCFLIYAINFEGIKTVTILIKIRLFETHVLVYHVHLLRNK